jgi:hypothetical protein
MCTEGDIFCEAKHGETRLSIASGQWSVVSAQRSVGSYDLPLERTEGREVLHLWLGAAREGGRVSQRFGFSPHRSVRAAFPHTALPEGNPKPAYAGHGCVIRGVGKGKRTSKAAKVSPLRRRWLRQNAATARAAPLLLQETTW